MTLPDYCHHYYADRSGGFGWPSCVICGQDAPSEAPKTPKPSPWLDDQVTGTPNADTPELPEPHQAYDMTRINTDEVRARYDASQGAVMYGDTDTTILSSHADIPTLLAALDNAYGLEDELLEAESLNDSIIGDLRDKLDRRSKSIQQLSRAVRNKGINPTYHDRQLDKLQQRWPELHSAIMAVLTEHES